MDHTKWHNNGNGIWILDRAVDLDQALFQEIRWPEEDNLTICKYAIFNGGIENGKYEFRRGFAVREERMH